uniref:AMP-binding, conserved site-containing protein n=1 Tax=Tanacetum cinerariifolium TaxID=118510 RepID=A0A699JAG9_TANCI|nr:AMP-binding, conserved site-containing protein [Tanacetum cinerariifolium]
MLELQFAVPMAGAIICPLNTRLDLNMIATLLKYSETKILFVDYQLLHKAKEAVTLVKTTHSEPRPPLIISEVDSQCPLMFANEYRYERLVKAGANDLPIIRPDSECDSISLSYTSGTTSKPKGLIFSHRGAYLNSLGCVFMHGMREMPTYLWFTVMVGACRGVTHMGGAPTVLNMIANSLVANQKPLPHRVEIMTAGAPPPPSVLSKIEELGFHVSHAYGLTQVYGVGLW